MTGPSWSSPAYEALAIWIHERTGLYFNPARRPDAEAGIQRVMAKAGISKIAECVRLLESNRVQLDDLIAELTVGETYFFRDAIQLEYIRHELLPQFRRRHGSERPLRAWSAGCASGEEAYSLAILFEQESVNPLSTILATDISRRALARARAATYTAWSLRGDDARLADRYFRRRADRFALDERFRQRVNFEYLNLALDSYPSLANGTWGMDLILCRNVLLYFDREAGRRVVRGLVDALADGGVLITGASDPLYQNEGGSEMLVTAAGVFYRRDLQLSQAEVAHGCFIETRPALAPSPPAPMPGLPEDGMVRMPACDPLAPEPAAAPDPAEAAAIAAAHGDHRRVIALTRHAIADPEAMTLYLWALANVGEVIRAEASAAQAVADYPLHPKLHFIHAMLLIALDRSGDAAQALRRALYLDRSLAAAHIALGQVLHRLGDGAGALRALRIGHDLAAARAPDEIMPLTDGETAGGLAAAAAAQLALQGGVLVEDRP